MGRPRRAGMAAYCEGQYAGWADRLRGTYVPVEASWEGYDAD